MMRLTFTAGVTLLFAGVFLAGCTNVRIEESDAFDVRRTISPRYFEEGSAEAVLEELRFSTSDGLELEGWYMRSPGAERTVLYVGGNGFVIPSSYHIITSILEQGVDLFVFNYRGYGTNPGKPSVDGVVRDAEAAYRYLRTERGVEPDELIIHGHSMGTLLAAGIAAQEPAGALVLESPITNGEDLTRRLVPAVLRPFISIELDEELLKLDNRDAVQRLQVPVLLVVGSEDNVTPKGMAEELAGLVPGDGARLEILEGGGHNDLPQRDDYRRILGEFYHR